MVRSGTCLRGRDGRNVSREGKGLLMDCMWGVKERRVKDDSTAFCLCVWINNSYFLGLIKFGEEFGIWFKSIRFPGGFLEFRGKVRDGNTNVGVISM